jgi:hypothetical protein
MDTIGSILQIVPAAASTAWQKAGMGRWLLSLLAQLAVEHPRAQALSTSSSITQ